MNSTNEEIESAFDAREKALAKIEIGWAKALLGLRTNMRYGHNCETRAYGLVDVHETLEAFRIRAEKGQTFDTLRAIAYCAQENVPLPEWLALSFQRHLDQFYDPSGPKSLDDVFRDQNLPTNTKKKKAEAIQDWQLGAQLWADVWELVLNDITLTTFHSAVQQLLRQKKYGVQLTTAKRLIKFADENQHALVPAHEKLSRFFEKRRKQ